LIGHLPSILQDHNPFANPSQLSRSPVINLVIDDTALFFADFSPAYDNATISERRKLIEPFLGV
jgi:hypothetical protein